MTPEARAIRNLVYATFASEGRAPSPAELARSTGSSLDEVGARLRELADAHALVLNRDGDAVRMAHPFSAAPMGFVVTPLDGRDDRRWWGGCAWDSFGISAALRLEVRIDTACPGCGRHQSVPAGPELPPPAGLVVRIPSAAARWWDDVVATCSSIRLFCGREHAERWAASKALSDGQVVEAATMWELAQPWYGDRLDPGYEPHSRDHNQQLLDRCGLTGSFWTLP